MTRKWYQLGKSTGSSNLMFSKGSLRAAYELFTIYKG